MYHDFTYEDALASSLRAQWHIDDVLRADQELDFTRYFMPASLSGANDAPGLSDAERRLLNQITANQYIAFFGVVEEFVLPFILDHARPILRDDDFRIRALLNFATEEAKHIQLFSRFQDAFWRGFPVPCPVVGKRNQLTDKILGHHPLAVGLIILMFEWMTQAHYLGSVRDDGDIDPLFRGLLKNHWMEEAQHAKLDTLIVDALVVGRSETELLSVLGEFFQILNYIDKSLQIQARLNLDALEQTTGRPVPNRPELTRHLIRTARWTYYGSGLVHDRFTASLRAMSPRVAERVARLTARAVWTQPA